MLFLLVRRPDGSPTGYPMTGLFRDGDIEFTTYRKAAKARYLLADDRVCCVIPDGAEGGVAVWGHAVPVASDAFADAARHAGPAPLDVPSTVRDSVRDALEGGKRMVFRVQVERARDVLLPERDDGEA